MSERKVMGNLKWVWIAWLVVVHFLLFVAVWKTNLVPGITRVLGFSSTSLESSHYRNLVQLHSRQAPQVPEGAVVFLGDSHVEALCVVSVAKNAVNFGIGGDTTEGLLKRIERVGVALGKARHIVVAVGCNDLAFNDIESSVSNMESILQALDGKRVTVSSVLPVNELKYKRPGRNAKIQLLNQKFAELTAQLPNVNFTDHTPLFDRKQDGELDDDLHIGDGLHLNDEGYSIWSESLRQAIRRPTSQAN